MMKSIKKIKYILTMYGDVQKIPVYIHSKQEESFSFFGARMK